MVPGSKWKKSHQLCIIAPSNTYLILFIYSQAVQEEFVKFVLGIAAADASWYFVNELGNVILSLTSLLGTSYDKTHYMLVFIGVARLSNNGPFRLLNEKMD